MLKVLYISDSPLLNTGYGRVARELIKGMTDSGHEVRAVGCGHPGGQHDLPCIIYPTTPEQDYWGYGLLPHILNTYESDVIMTLSDPWAVEPLPGIIEHFPVYWVGYFPIDGRPVPGKWRQLIDRMDKIVVISEFARNAVQELLPHRQVEVLPHGVNTEVFQPYPPETIVQMRRQQGWQDRFVVLNVNRNQMRKQIPLTIKGFAKFARDKDDVLLVLRMRAVERVGWDLPDLLQRFDLYGKATIVDAPPASGIPEELLVQLYNMADLHVSTTAGEGFGLTTLEAMSCGTPVLITDCSNSRELVQSEKQLIKVREMMIATGNIEQAYADADDLAEKLEYFYRNRSELELLGQKSRQFALTLTWDNIREKLGRLLEDVQREIEQRRGAKIKFYSI